MNEGEIVHMVKDTVLKVIKRKDWRGATKARVHTMHATETSDYP
jgi:hypothetical protein